ncbi:hypothetical protein BV22DRAFT_1134608 [Leucogyrophana mollusca]|uniref:Uncharacterized protein n=1 Tax=Leucogyrophana mollusca TaxID=85980 RepID=A0ACB8AZK1_9AGAM|nr:hypothetical protein BV22DRAFT_1134608 [Leucogyrophana mollusca]
MSTSFSANATPPAPAANNGNVASVDVLAAALSGLTLDASSASTLIAAIVSATTNANTAPASASSDFYNTTDLTDSTPPTRPSSPTSSAPLALTDIITTPATTPGAVNVTSPAPIPAPAPPVAANATTIAQVAAANAAAFAAFLEAASGVQGVVTALPPPPPPAPQIWKQSYRAFVYEVPSPSALPPFYCISKGTRVGVFSGWQTTSPLVIGVSRSCHSRVSSRDAGIDKFHNTVDTRGVEVLLG